MTASDEGPRFVEERRSVFRSNLSIEPMSRRIAVAAGVVLAYAVLFVLLYRQGGVGVAALSIFPVVVLAWLFGAWGGLLAGIGSVAMNAGLLGLVGEPGWSIVVGTGAVEGSALVIVVGCVIGLLRDLGLRLDRQLTDWRQTERALHDSEDRYRLLFERSRHPMYVSRPDGHFVDANDALVRFLGYSRSELLDLDVVHIYEDPADRERFAETIRRDGFVKDLPVRLLTKGGDVRECLLTSTARFEDGEIKEYQGSMHDVSQDRVLHELAERRTRELQDAIAEMESFSYSVSHDLRTHLVTMGGFASILWDDHRDGLDEKGQDFLRRIVAAGTRMDDFVADMLDLSKVNRRAMTLGPLSVSAVVAEAMDVLTQQIQERGATMTVDEDLGTAQADRVLLARVVQHLISNAVKFVPEDRSPTVHVRVSDDDGRLRLEVEDNGIGIAPDDVATAFRAFERLEPARFKGTGVGLAIVLKSVERMGGGVGVESRPGEGSVFWVTLPRAVASPPPVG